MTGPDVIECIWTGDSFVPVSPFMKRRASDRFGEGEAICMNAEEARSMRSHRHYFAQLKDYWLNIPERFSLEPWAQSPEHFRRFLLIRSGYSTTTTYACESKAEAGRLAAAIRPLDEFGVVVARGQMVHRFTAESQSVRHMGAKRFQESKSAVLEAAEALVAGGDLPTMQVAA